MKVNLSHIKFEKQGITINTPGLRHVKLLQLSVGVRAQLVMVDALWMENSLIGVTYTIQAGEGIGGTHTFYATTHKVDFLMVAPATAAPVAVEKRGRATEQGA